MVEALTFDELFNPNLEEVIMCSSATVKSFYIPRNDYDYVTQGTCPLRKRLALEDAECTPFILRLEKDHEKLALACQRALDNEKGRKETEAKSNDNTWTAYSIRLLKKTAFTTTITVTIALFVAYTALSAYKPVKSHLLLGTAGGLLWGYWITPSNIESQEPKSSELSVVALMERTWMKTWLEHINVMYKESADKIAKGDESDATRDTRDQQLRVKSFFEHAVARY